MTIPQKISTSFDWSLLSPDQFEELCYDVLKKDKSLGFSTVEWFKGTTGQRGRDIEAKKIISTISGKSREERWIIQCKHYLSRSIGVRDFMDTIAWADSHNPEAILMIASSFLSSDAKDYIKGLYKQKRYKIEYIEIDELERIIKNDIELINKYFSGMYNYDRILVTDASIDDLDENVVKWFVRKRGVKFKVKGEKNKLVNILRNINAVEVIDEKTIPTVAGILLFGENPQRFIPHGIVQIARFRGVNMNNIIEMKKIDGRLTDIINECEKFIKENTKKVEKIDFKTEETFIYPIEAIGEAIINAIAHRDYSLSGRNIRVMLFDDRIEIENPGGLPADLTVENFEGRHFARNEVIAQCLYDVKYMQKFGTGIGRMKELSRKKKFKKALVLYLESEEVLKKLGDKFNLMNVYYSLVLCYRDMNQEEKAVEYYQKAEELRKRLGIENS